MARARIGACLLSGSAPGSGSRLRLRLRLSALAQAPVIDSCGSAGGRLPGQPEGIALAVFTNSSLAFEGQKGSTLPAMPSQATWKR